MSGALPFLAQLPLPNPTTKVPGLWASDLFLIFLAALLLGGVIAGWIFLSQKKKKGVSPARRVYKGTSSSESHDSSSESGDRKRRRRKRTRRRDHRGRNPTLSETGGLPPPRDSETPLIP